MKGTVGTRVRVGKEYERIARLGPGSILETYIGTETGRGPYELLAGSDFVITFMNQGSHYSKIIRKSHMDTAVEKINDQIHKTLSSFKIPTAIILNEENYYALCAKLTHKDLGKIELLSHYCELPIFINNSVDLLICREV